MQSLRKLARDGLVKGLSCNPIKDETDLCRTCIKGKIKKATFPVGESKRAKEPLNLVHSDVCGKLNARTMGGAEYFLTFVDDCTWYT